MAFANLFTGLSALDRVENPSRLSKEPDDGRRGRGRKRGALGGQSGPHNKKQRYQQDSRISFKYDDSKAKNYHMQNTGREQHEEQSHHCKASHNTTAHNGQNSRVKQNRKKVKKQKKNQRQHQQRDRGGPPSQGGGHQMRITSRRPRGNKNTHGNNREDVRVPRFMTQEFKDQNALLVDGQLVCRHFVMGRCIKGDSCQLQHIQGYNNLIKEMCKFYVQGFCTKGESCVYMHNSFPCKFFHRRGNCSNGDHCRFSHDPLNDVTEKLLDDAIKLDVERAKKAEETSQVQPANTEESEVPAEDKTPDVLKQPVWLNFYNCAESNATKETSEEVVDALEEAVPTREPAAQSHNSPSNHNLDGPVCYSVEALLGPQLSKPFSSFPRYAANVDSSATSHTPTRPATVFYTPATEVEESSYPPSLAKDTSVCSVNEKANPVREETFKNLSSSQERAGLTSATSGHQGGECVDMLVKPVEGASAEVKVLDSVTTGAETSTGPTNPKCSHQVPADVTCSIDCGSESAKPSRRVLQSLFSRPLSQMSTSKPSTHVSVLSSESQASKNSLHPSFTVCKDGTAVTSTKNSHSANNGSHQSTRRPFAAIGQHPIMQKPGQHPIMQKSGQHPIMQKSGQHPIMQKSGQHPIMQKSGQHPIMQKSGQHPIMQKSGQHPIMQKSGLKSVAQQLSDITVECKSGSGSEENWIRPLNSLPATPISGVLSSTTGSSETTSACPQQPAGFRSKAAVEPNQVCARSVRSLFATPLTDLAAPLPGVQPQLCHSRTSHCPQESNQSVSDASHSSPSTQRTSPPRLVKTDDNDARHAARSPTFMSIAKMPNDKNSVNQSIKQEVSPAHSFSETSVTPHQSTTRQQPSLNSDHNVSSLAAPSKSVLKTLFQSLDPFLQDNI